MVPWFIPTKDDQRKWYRDELNENPKEVQRLTREFSSLSREYAEKLGRLESRIAEDYETYQLYLEVKHLAQQTNFTWNRIETKQRREDELLKRMCEL
jgi:uncharacterized membrane protein YgaE (UPF0421/DUF939 family)